MGQSLFNNTSGRCAAQPRTTADRERTQAPACSAGQGASAMIRNSLLPTCR